MHSKLVLLDQILWPYMLIICILAQCIYSKIFLFPLKYLNKSYESLLLPYFFSYKMDFFFLRKQSKNLGPSYKMDLDLWDCLGRIKLAL